MIKENLFKKYIILGEDNIEVLDIDSIYTEGKFKEDVYNNTNHPNTYFIKERVTGEFDIMDRDNLDIDIRYRKIITREPLNLGESDYIVVRLKEVGSQTIKEFLDLDYIPRLNIGDVNPEPHGAILIEESLDNTEFYIQKIDKIDDEQGYAYIEAIVPVDVLENDYTNILDIELSEYACDAYGSKNFEGHLFFNKI